MIKHSKRQYNLSQLFSFKTKINWSQLIIIHTFTLSIFHIENKYLEIPERYSKTNNKKQICQQISYYSQQTIDYFDFSQKRKKIYTQFKQSVRLIQIQYFKYCKNTTQKYQTYFFQETKSILLQISKKLLAQRGFLFVVISKFSQSKFISNFKKFINLCKNLIAAINNWSSLSNKN
ncbi:hypothetical protein ABPG72_012379 [Tetrahymena utriculariae]